MNAKVMQIDRPQMTMRTKLGTLAMAVVAAMTLGGAEPAFAHGPNNPRVEGPDKRWHWNMYHVPNQGAERLHDRNMLLCSKVGSLIIVPPEVGAEWAAGERIWWRYWLYKWDAATGWQPLQGFGPSGWREYGRDPSDNRWFKGANENLSVAPGYYHAKFDVYWSTHGASAHMHAEQYWQGTNNANWVRVPSNPYCET
jgi:hypothetical protein